MFYSANGRSNTSIVSRIRPQFRGSLFSSPLLYCPFSSLILASLNPTFRFPYQSLMSPTEMYSVSTFGYPCRCQLGSPLWASARFSRGACRGRTLRPDPYLQVSLNLARTASFSNHPCTCGVAWSDVTYVVPWILVVFRKTFRYIQRQCLWICPV